MNDEFRNRRTISDAKSALDDAVVSEPSVPLTFPPRLIILLKEIAGGSIWQYSDGASMEEDGKSALAWIEKHGGLAKIEEEDAA